MSLVYILAEVPWGPVKIQTAADVGALLRQGTRPAHMETVEDRDAARIVAAATAALGGCRADGLITTSVEKAIRSLVEAHRAPSATKVAADPAEAVSGPPVSQGEAVAIAERAAPAVERYSPTRPVTDVLAIRNRLGMSQGRFARSFGVSLHTLQDWEQGRSRPDQTARAFLRVIEARPDVVREVVGRS